MYRRAVTLVVAALTSLSVPASAQTAGRVLDSLDVQAHIFMEYLRCSANAFHALQRGIIAPLDSGSYELCAMVGSRMTAAYVTFDSSGKRPRRLSILDPGRMVERREPTDTAEILVLLRAQRYADWLTWKDSVNGPRGLPVVYRQDTVIHVWMFPLLGETPDTVYVGGERHFIFPSDAKKEISGAPVPARRAVTQVNGAFLIKSVGDTVPTFNEILAANVIAEDHRDVTIELSRHYLKLVTSPNMGAWIWMPKKPD